MLGKPSDTAILIGIDPGTTKLGLCTLEFNVDTLEAVKIEAVTLDGDKLPSSPWMGSIYGDRFQRIYALRTYLIAHFREVKPISVGSESPFYNRNRPNAYAALIEVICGLREAYVEYSTRSPMYLIDPPTVKKAVGAAGNADKVSVKQKILSHPILSALSTTPIQELDEHSLDAMAVAWCMLVDLQKGQMTLKTQL